MTLHKIQTTYYLDRQVLQDYFKSGSVGSKDEAQRFIKSW